MKHFIPFILIFLYLIGDFSLLNEKMPSAPKEVCWSNFYLNAVLKTHLYYATCVEICHSCAAFMFLASHGIEIIYFW